MMKIALLLVALVMPLIFAEGYREPEQYKPHHGSVKKHAPKYTSAPVYYPPKKQHKPKKPVYCPKPKTYPQTKCYLYSPKYYDTAYEVETRKVCYEATYDTYGKVKYPSYCEDEQHCKRHERAHWVYEMLNYKKDGYSRKYSDKEYVDGYQGGYRGYAGGQCTAHDIGAYCEMRQHGQGQKEKHNGGNATLPNCKKCHDDYAACRHGRTEMTHKHDSAVRKYEDCAKNMAYYDSLGTSSTSTESSNSASTLSIVLIVVGAVMLLAGLSAMAVARRQIRKGAADNAPNAVMVAQTDPLRAAP